MPEKIPSSYDIMEKKLSVLNDMKGSIPYVSYDRFSELALSAGVPSNEDVGGLLTYFHDIGQILYFKVKILYFTLALMRAL
tara:strand:- start:992 stop:1234 length:243 start_codon:yes stop_codon:yes gene_type:complete